MRLWQANWRDNNPEAYTEKLAWGRLFDASRRANDPRYQFRKHLHHCLIRHTWAPEELTWKTHVPVVYEEKVFRQCAGCDRLPQGGGLRLWYVYPMQAM
jgi:hypothetical protein